MDANMESYCDFDVMSRMKLNYIVENPEYTKKLAGALEAATGVAKKRQIIELLSALCVYDAAGHQRALETMEHYMRNKRERYRFKVVADELRSSKDLSYLSALAAFVNCTIISAKSLKDRMHIRNEYIGLKILEIFSKLKNEYSDITDNELIVQLDIFDVQRQTDECQIASGVDLNSHQDVFFALLRQVSETPHELPFLSVLQHLLRVDPACGVADRVWGAAEKLVHRATLCETREDVEKLLAKAPNYPPNVHKLLKSIQETGGCRCQCSCHNTGESCGDGGRTRKRTLMQLSFDETRGPPGILSPTSSSNAFSPEVLATLARAISPPPKATPPLGPPASGPPQPPPLPGPPPGCGPPPPPPLPGPPLGGPPPPPPPPPPSSLTTPRFTKPPAEDLVKLPQQATPKPRNKMKSLNWTKIPSNKVVGRTNLWSLIAKAHDGSPNDLNFEAIEDLFCQQTSGPQSPRLVRRGDAPARDGLDRRKREASEINLLDGKRSLNVNIFLKQFRSSNNDIIGILKRGAHDEIGAEKLRGLLQVLPESDEIELLRGYTGDRFKLGNAEKFLLQMIELSNYKLRCEGMLLKEEFASNMAFLQPAIESIEAAVDELKHCKELHEVLYMLLVAGNFLNSGGYAGDAAGFKMMSLLKVAEIRANKPGMNLVHYVAQEAETKFPNLLKLPELLPNLEEASKLSIENLKSEIQNLSNKLLKISQQVSTSGGDLKQQMGEFLAFAEREVRAVQKHIDNLDKVRSDLADFLCEDLQSFKLEECFKVFHSFCKKFKSSIEENQRRRQQEKRAEERRKQREEQFALKKKISDESRPHSFSGSESDNIIDMLLSDIRGGLVERAAKGRTSGASEDEPPPSPASIPRRLLVGGSSDADGHSTPDVTPDGTLRRRRPRLSSEDKEGSLIEFLRQSEEAAARSDGKGKVDNGSLDRSLLRRSSRKRRPEMIALELNERERPASPGPSPLLERRKVPLEPEANKPKQWRTKIEEWLQENEKEQAREKKLKEKIVLERRKRQEMEQRDSDVSSSFDKSDEWRSNKNLETLHEAAKTDSELYAKKDFSYKKQPDASECGSSLKDKSRWRKSNLNVANSSESIDDERRRGRSRKSKSEAEGEETISFYLRGSENAETEDSTTNNCKDLPALNNRASSAVSTLGHLEVINNAPVCSTIPTITGITEETSKKSEERKVLPSVPKPEKTVNNNSDIAIGQSRFYQSKREPSFNKVGQSSALDDLPLQKIESPKEIDGSHLNPIAADPSEKDDEGNFDRFSFMRKTTRRSKVKPTISDTEIKRSDSIDNHILNTEDSDSNAVRVNPQNKNTFDETVKMENRKYKDVIQTNKDTQNLLEEKNRNHGIFAKNFTDRVVDQTDDTKRKDKPTTSLKARLSKRLLSLTENIMGGTKAVDDTTSTKKPVEDKAYLVQEPSSIEKVSNEKRTSLKEEKPNSVGEERGNVLPPPIKDTIQVSQSSRANRKLENFTPMLTVEPKLLKESYVADTNNIRVVHAIPVNHNFKACEPCSPQKKGKDESEKDEGFEETQSQVSEVASQEAGSNYDTDLADSPRSVRQTKSTKPDNPLFEKKLSDDSLKLDESKENVEELSHNKIELDPSEKSFSKAMPPKSLPLDNNYGKQSKLTLKMDPKPPHSGFNTLPSRTTTSDKTTPKINNQVANKISSMKNFKSTSDQKSGINRRNSKETNVDSKSKSMASKGTRPIRTDASPKIGRRVAGYTKAINSMTNNLRGSKQFESYDVTQSMPPTPSEEQKSLLSTLKVSENAKKTRSSSSMHSPRSTSRRCSERSLNSSLRASNKNGSEKSLSRRSSDRSLNLSRKSSEASVVTVRSVNIRQSPRRPKPTPSSQNNNAKPISNSRTISRVVAVKPKVPLTKSSSLSKPGVSANKTITRSNSSAKPSTSPVRSNAAVRRTSSDKSSCGFMKATSASSAKSFPSKSLNQDHISGKTITRLPKP